ncbi:class I SAM-dependent methyltransferase [Novosphingobium album (ex Liu et al. 2023)]|uniref:Class I SAM-dependent methyltransferase n=1 Tax=Novosphingobium album (ex Liu et al. 2023) TaxID=3031130 RepID=A0ABT5WQB5_9SPHN|nr:class I SAM-dependent methyltransferase [Novosphingobium album (ex Liu et al. 2023)]MDE8651477.1 class I SAM-dependent methyltransferase [Novosphingobium album (ex Liu et al. 2023)]
MRLNALSKPPHPGTIAHDPIETAAAYDFAGPDYLAYADGRMDALFAFDGRYSFADQLVWQQIDAALKDLLARGRHSIRILDAGCGPGTWLVRTVTRAQALGFDHVDAIGFDISPEMIRLARENAVFKGHCQFRTGDLCAPLPEEAGGVDLTLCLYGVLNHLPRDRHEQVAAELVRVTSGHLLITVRTVGSLPTIFVGSLEKARSFCQDNGNDRFEVDLIDGRHLEFTSHLFCAAEFKALFEPHAPGSTLLGLDVFHSRFAAHPWWNPDALPYSSLFEQELCKLEERCGSDPVFIDRAAHILLHADCSR